MQVLSGRSNATVPVLVPRCFSVHDLLGFLLMHPAVLRVVAVEATHVSRSALRLWIQREGCSPELFLEPASLEGFAIDYATRVSLLLDVRNPDGSWPGGEVPYPSFVDSPSAGQSWTLGVKAGSFIDAKDEGTAKTWFCGQIMRVIPPDDIPLPPSANDKLCVHFIAWGSGFDVCVPRSEEWIRPLLSMTGRWRHGVRPGDRIEVRNPQRKDGTDVDVIEYKWYLGWVLEVDHVHLPPQARILVPKYAKEAEFAGTGRNILGPVRVVSLLSDDIDQVGTKMNSEKLLRRHQVLPCDAEISRPPAPPCLPYTELANAMLQLLVRLDAESHASAVATLPALVGRLPVS